MCFRAAGGSPSEVEFCPSGPLHMTVCEEQDWKLIAPASIIKVISAYPLLGQED